MLRRITRGLGLVALMALAGGCGTTTSTVVNPTPNPTTVTFTGLLNPVSSNVFSFVAITGGAVTATLTSIGPDATANIGFSLGTFNTSTNQCSVVFDNTAAVQGAVFNTTASTTGTYCVRLYDNGSVSTAAANGTASAFSYTVTVVHP